MKKSILILVFSLTLGYAKAQISEVKINGSSALIYNEKGRFSGYTLNISGKEIMGYNSKFLVIRVNSIAYIYDSTFSNTGYSISLGSNKKIKSVTESNILVKEGNAVYYYDFKGAYTGNSTTD